MAVDPMIDDLTLQEPAYDYEALAAQLAEARDDATLFTSIVNSPFEFRVASALLFLGIVVLLQVNPETGMIDRVALSSTELAKNTTDVSAVPFDDIKIPLNHDENILSKAVQTGQPQETTDWKYLFAPAMTAEQARINQASGGIAYSAVYPLLSRNGGAMIFSYFQYQADIGKSQHEFMQTYAQLVDEALGR